MPRRFVPLVAALGLVVASLATASRIPLFDPDEGFYPATAAESVASGDWWDLRFNGEARWDKPVLAYALIEGSFAVFGKHAFAARLPSAIEAAALVLLVSAILSKLAGARASACAAAVLSSTLGVQIFGRAAHPEIAVVLSIGVTEMLLIWWLVSSPDDKPAGLSILIGLSLGYGLLAKGPVAVAVPLLGGLCAAPFVTSLRHRWTEAIGDAGVAGAVGMTIAAPWYVAMTWRHGMTFLASSVWAQNVGRYTGAVRHGQSALTFIAGTLVGLIPWMGLLPAALARVRRPQGDRRNAVRFTAAVMAVASLVFYASSASKLASYSLALLPPLSVVIGLYVDDLISLSQSIKAPRRRVSLAWISAASALALLALALIAVPSLHGVLRTHDVIGGVSVAQDGSAFRPANLRIGAVLLIGAVLVFLLPIRGRIAALYGVGIAVPLVALLALGPMLDDAYPWRRFGEQIARTHEPAWIQNYRAPSLTFWAAQPVTRVSGDEELEAVLATTSAGWIILGADWTEKPLLADRIHTGHATVIDRTPRLALVQLK
jgi:4-amino-4-deoxy-L-arabinose transferase-like glycosyltransferase